MQRLLTAVAAGALATVATAQLSVVIPEGYANQVENSANIFPFGTTGTSYSGLRILHIYDSANFTNQQVTSPVLINRLRWRAQDTSSSWTGGSYTNVTIQLSTAPVDHLAASTTWAANHGPDLTVVHSGPVAVQGLAGNGPGVPGPWFVDVQLPTPFLYDPTAGDLSIDVDNVGVGANWTGGTTTALASVSSSGNPPPAARRVYSSSQYPNANNVDQNILVMEIGYVPPQGYAQKAAYGQGCYQVDDVSFYESFLAGTFDLAPPNTPDNMTMLFTGTGYVVLSGLTTFVTPPGSATALTLSDDDQTTVTLSAPMPVSATATTNSLTICSNGFVSVGNNGTPYTPSVSTFLNNGSSGWYSWHDFNPAAGGTVWFWEAAGVAYVTWDNVPSYGQTTGETFQFQFDIATGNVSIVWVSIANLGNGYLVGYSEGGPSNDPGSIDLSTLLPQTIPNAATFAIDPLALDASDRPVIGSNFTLDTTGIPPNSPVGGTILSLTELNPGIAIPGMAGCEQYVTTDAVVLFVPSGSSASVPFAIPANNGLAGVVVTSQSATIAPGVNAIGALTSNGLRMTLDVN